MFSKDNNIEETFINKHKHVRKCIRLKHKPFKRKIHHNIEKVNQITPFIYSHGYSTSRIITCNINIQFHNFHINFSLLKMY